LIAIVSNNSRQAVRSYLAANRLGDYIGAISARSGPDVSQLKPSPHLLDAAIQKLGCGRDACVMVGDSASDIEAARGAGVAVIAFANKPGKHDRLAALHPDAIIRSMADLVGQHV
jgi:phosphoglycolate phosphatase-like HAD superfamily hydrolase